MRVLVTGGAGYIGSHAVKSLQRAGHRVVVIDNLSRGWRPAVTGDAIIVVHDLADWEQTARVLATNRIDCVMHFAAFAYVGESVGDPLGYYNNNTSNAIATLRAMKEAGVNRFVFSSTCATYGQPPEEMIPIPERCPQAPISPYGWSKLFVERVLFDYGRANPDFQFALLRYFNVAGCDPEGEIGEDHKPETHLIPLILQAALGQRKNIQIFGADYDTPDGTCIRDYIHVQDLARAHIMAMEALRPGDPLIYNLGIGKGYSVREVIDAAQRVSGRRIAVVEGPRREGDPPRLFADSSKVQRELGWSPRFVEIDEIVATAWNWMAAHPQGYYPPRERIRA